ncbi:MAG: hypothetical protein ACI4OC_03910 [Coriobacteriales bacterium]
MANNMQTANPQELFQQVFNAAAQLPGVRIDREKYLTGALKNHFSPEVVAAAVASSPAAAGITPERLASIADASIAYETAKVTAISTAAGIPGGLAALGTVPADLAQYFSHVMRIAQKLAYLYGWENMFDGSEEEIDDAAKSMLILFVGVMFGAQGACEAVGKVAEKAAAAAAKRIPQKALMNTTIYPIVKKVAGYLGVTMTKEIYGKGISKAIPVIGAVISGGITLASYAPMCLTLKNYLAGLEVADPATYVIEVDAAIEPSGEDFEE